METNNLCKGEWISNCPFPTCKCAQDVVNLQNNLENIIKEDNIIDSMENIRQFLKDYE